MERHRRCQWYGLDINGRQAVDGWINLLPKLKRKNLNNRPVGRCDERKREHSIELDKGPYKRLWILGGFEFEAEGEVERHWEDISAHSFSWGGYKKGRSIGWRDNSNKFFEPVPEDASALKVINDRGNNTEWSSPASGGNQREMHCGDLRGNWAVIIDWFSIIVPFGNIKDLEKIEPELRKKAQFYPVKEMKEVLGVAFPTLWEGIAPKLWWLRLAAFGLNIYWLIE